MKKKTIKVKSTKKGAVRLGAARRGAAENSISFYSRVINLDSVTILWLVRFDG